MKTPRMVKAIGFIDEELITDALEEKKIHKKSARIKKSLLAACFVGILTSALIVVSSLHGDGNTILPAISGDNQNHEDIENTTIQSMEAVFSEIYVYSVSDGVFASYVSGKVISEEKIGDKISDVTVNGGWKTNRDGQYEWLTSETLRAEVYLINGISKEVAVALKFIDKGDALTTTHYYVIMNPEADLTSVRDYVIWQTEINDNGNEAVQNKITEEYAVEYTTTYFSE